MFAPVKKEKEKKVKAEFNPEQAMSESTEWLSQYFNNNNLHYDYKTDSIRNNGEVLDPKIMQASLRLALASKKGDTGYLKKVLPDLLTMWKHQEQNSVIESYRDKLKYNANNSGYLIEWIKAATGKREQLDIAVMTHFIWQVKRKLFKMSVEHHMMPILYGKSGGGKSVAVEKLLQPIIDLALTTNMGVFEDRFGKRQFTRNFIMFFDELNGAGSTDVNKLKQVITSPIMEWRVMHSEGVASAPQNCTFIGCTNDPVSERIKDPTSARRFWQLNCADKLDWSVLNSIDYVQLWQSVDENGPCPILPMVEELRKVQDTEVRAKDVIEQWLTTSIQTSVMTETGRAYQTSKSLYDHFTKWCEWQSIANRPGFLAFTKSLPKKLEQLSMDSSFTNDSRGTVWNLKIKE